jgi:cyclase
MKRLGILTGLLLTGAISLMAAQQLQQNPPAALEIQKVKDNLYMITGSGGNTAVFITEKGVVVVDTKNPGDGPGILEKIKSVTPKPVIIVINTHMHRDHVGSNGAFAGTVEIVAHTNTRVNMEKISMFQSDEGTKFLPGKTYRDKLSLLNGTDRVDLYYFGRGHTDGDTFVVFPALKVMHTGDMFPEKAAPFVDTENGGSGVEYPDTLAKAAAGIKGIEMVMPGHSPVTDWNAFKEYGEFVRDLVAAIERARKDGKDVDQAVAEIKLPEKYKDYDMRRLKGDVTTLYSELK